MFPLENSEKQAERHQKVYNMQNAPAREKAGVIFTQARYARWGRVSRICRSDVRRTLGFLHDPGPGFEEEALLSPISGVGVLP